MNEILLQHEVMSSLLLFCFNDLNHFVSAGGILEFGVSVIEGTSYTNVANASVFQ